MPFVGPARDAGDWDVVKNLFAADKLSDEQRRMLLSGKSADGLVSAGPVVCACFGVGRSTICAAISAGAVTPAPAPIAAPLPPPAMAPITAPRAAPPPIFSAS